MVQVELERHDVRGGLLERVEGVVARFLAVEQRRPVGRGGDILVHDVDLALQGLEQEHLGIGHHLVDHAVEIGQLRTLGVDLEIVGIAGGDRQLGAFAGRRIEHPGIERGPPGVLEEGVVVLKADLALEQGDPALHALLARQGVGIGIVADVELLEIVLGTAGELVLLGPGQLLQEEAVRGGEGDLEGLLVDHLEPARLAVGVPEALAAEAGLGIGEIGIVPELDVGGGIGMAVGPFVPLAQPQRVFGGVGVDLVALGHVLDHARPFGIEAHQRLVALVAHQHGQRAAAHQGVVPVAALPARTLEGRDDQRIGRQALGDGRQFAGIDPCLQEGGFGRRLPARPNWQHERTRQGGTRGDKSSTADTDHNSPPLANIVIGFVS